MKAAELFDELLDLTVSYPKTFALLLVGRSSHFASGVANRCPAGAFALLTLVGLYIVLQGVQPGWMPPFKLPEWLKPELALGVSFVALGVLVNIQFSVLRLLYAEFRPPAAVTGAVLVYPYCVTLVLIASVGFLSPRERMGLSIAFVHAIYLWTLFTSLRGAGSMKVTRAIGSALLAYGGFVLFSVAITLLLIAGLK